jgi:hypothetical protein
MHGHDDELDIVLDQQQNYRKEGIHIMKHTAGNMSAKNAAFASPLPQVQITADGNPNAK